MKQTIHCIMFVLISFCAFSQNRPGVDYFPQIGFFDFIVNYKSPPNGLSSTSQIAKMTEDNGYYFDKLLELGMTNFVSDGQVHADSLAIPSPFRINDMGFSWKAETHSFNPSIYMNAIGHDKQKYPVEFGGTPLGNIDPDDANYGFVRPGANRTNYWSMTPSDLPLDIDSTGFDDEEEIGNATIYYRGVRTGTDEPGAMVWGKLPPVQFPFANLNHIMKIRIRKLNTGGANLEAIRIIVSSTPLNELNIKKFYSNVYKNGFSPDVNLAPLGLQQAVSDTAIHWINDYGWFETQMFTLKKSEQLYFAILWPGNIDLNIDKIAIMTQKYNEVFEIDTAATELFMDNIQTDIVSQYGSDPGRIIQDFYFDEPFLLTARYRSKLQQKIREAYSGYNTMHLNGATGNVPEYFHRFENEYARENTTQPVGNYFLYDMYPFSEIDGYGQTTVQDRLDELVSWPAFGSAHAQHDYSYAGLRPALMAANQYDSDVTNDVPLFMTLQVQAEHQVIGGHYAPSAGGKRAPSRDEIFAMGNVSLAYGVKGFMYYMVPTRCEIKATDTIWGTYGLFDEEGNEYEFGSTSGWVQDAGNKQIPNSRFTAVKDFIASLKPVETTLLGLTWQDAKSWNTTTSCSVNWITNLSSRYPPFGEDDEESKTFVETGYFLEKSPPSGKVEDAKFIYLVNRRCNIQPENSPDNYEDNPDTSYRSIRFYLNFPNSNWNNYTVTDLKTDSIYCTTKTGMVTLFLGAGEGTLLKIEPTIQSGGTIVTNETIGSGTYTVDTTLVVPQNVKLTVNAGAKLTFKNSGKLLILDGKLEVNGTESNKVEFDFVAKHWSAGNGIFAYRTPLKIKNAIIKNASCGIYSHISPGDTIDGVSTDSTHCGISLYYSYNYGSDNTVIKNSYFQNSQLWGITMIGSRPLIYNNWFTNMAGYGISANTESAPVLMDTVTKVGNNRFELNGTSINSLNSIPVIGTTDYKENYFGGNCFHADTVSLRAIYEGDVLIDINAYGSDWGATDPSEFRIVAEPNVTVWTDGYNSDCSGIWLNPNILSGGSVSPKQMESGGDPDSIKTLIKDVRRMIAQGQLRDALGVLTDIINGTTDLRYKKSAVSLIPQCYEYVNMSELKSNLLSIRNTGGLFKFTTMLLMNIDTENMDTYKQEILNSGNNKMYGAGDNSEEVMMIFNNLVEEKYKSSGIIDTVGKVTPLLTYLNSNFPTSEYTKSANLLFSDVSNSSSPVNSLLNKPQVSGTETEGIEYDYNLYNNYPNPFNPETVIKFSLKEKSNITLEVYNIAGQKVAELVTGEMEKGMYEKRFDGARLSSGVYIFRLNAQSLESTTHYSKTMKSLLLK